jgi:Trypsin
MAAARSLDAFRGGHPRASLSHRRPPEGVAVTSTPSRRAVDGAAWAGGGAVARTTGRVFFTLDGSDFACSGSVVDGTSADVVVTAAHCVSDGAGGWARNWTFIPGYAQGRAPLGAYPATMYVVAEPWASGADEDYDVAFVAVGPAKVGSLVRHVADAAGGQPIAFGPRGGRADVFGYPAVAPYTGGRLDYCAGPVTPDPYGAADAGIACAMTEGDSGGPWLSGFNPRTGLGTITGISSFKYSGAARTLYSPDLGSVAQDLYTRAESGQ